MTYDEFVDRYCDGKSPVASQRAVIEAYLNDPSSQQLWLQGRGGGKTTCLEWLKKADAMHKAAGKSEKS